MRIRRRQEVPLPLLSSLSPVRLSDPLSNQSSLLVQLRNTTTNNNNYLSLQPADDHLPQSIGDPTNVNTNGDCSELLNGVEDERGEDDDGREKVNNVSTTRSKLVLPVVDSSTTASSLLQGSVRRWGDMGEKAFPLKKRRGSLEKRSSVASSTSSIVVEKHKKIPSSSTVRSMKADVNKESEIIGEENIIDDDDNEAADTKEGDSISAVANLTTNNGGAKSNKRNRGGTLMEGSRCSRVNGRGWRCCQQTLVGYSLCEHHLGKGRLRSMTSVRSRSAASKTMGNNNHQQPPKQPVVSSNSLGMSSKSKSRDDGEGDNEGEKKNVAMTMMKSNKKKMKLGVVKARSMSSLLGQGNATNVAYGNDDIDNNNDEEDFKERVKLEGESENNV